MKIMPMAFAQPCNNDVVLCNNTIAGDLTLNAGTNFKEGFNIQNQGLLKSRISVTTSNITYYVDDAPTANDSNPGTSRSLPWKTINHAGRNTSAGDTVKVMDGIYYQALFPSNSGSAAGGYITYQSENIHGTLFDGYSSLNDVALDDGLGWTTTTPGQFPLASNAWKRSLQPQQLQGPFIEAYKNNVRMPAALNPLDMSYNASKAVDGNCWVDNANRILYVFLAVSENPNNFSWNITRQFGVKFDADSFIAVRDIRIERYGESGITIWNSNNLKITNNKIENNGRTGIGIAYNGDNIWIEKNYVARNGGGLGFSSGISIHKPLHRNIFVNNNTSSYNTDSSEFRSDGNGFILDRAADDGVIGAGCDFKNNVAYGNFGSGIRLFRSENSKIINNTTFKNLKNELELDEGGLGATIDAIESQNNIFHSRNTRPAMRVKLSSPLANTIILNYNDYYRNNVADTSLIEYNGNLVTLNIFQQTTGKDTNSISLDPIFVNNTSVDSLDLHLQTISPCINRGNLDLDNDGVLWDTDIDDQDPDGTRLDIGAFYFHQTPDTQNATSIVEEFNPKKSGEDNIKVYPNPTPCRFVVDMTFDKEQAEVMVSVTNILGEVILKHKLNDIKKELYQIDLSKYGAGIYFIKVESGVISEKRKVVVIR